MQAKLGVDELFFSALNARDGDPPNFLPTVNSNNEVTADQGYTPQNEKQVYLFSIWTPRDKKWVKRIAKWTLRNEKQVYLFSIWTS